MKFFFILILIISSAFFISLNAQDERLIVYQDENENCGYKNVAGEIIVPAGQFEYCFSDTADHYIAVSGSNGKIYALNIEGDTLFEILNFDNGPDYISEGLFRIILDDKIGYSNAKGEIIIQPQFKCAYPFKNNKAKVSQHCDDSGGRNKHSSDEIWYFVNRSGDRVK